MVGIAEPTTFTFTTAFSFLAFSGLGSEDSSSSTSFEVACFFDFLFLGATGQAPPYMVSGISSNLMVSPVVFQCSYTKWALTSGGSCLQIGENHPLSLMQQMIPANQYPSL